jgi:cytolysin-activating lysine-acyltransferase
LTGLVDSRGRALPLSEAPDDTTLRAYGDAAFLAMRSPRHAASTVSSLRAALEPPLIMGQYRIFRFDGVPRGIITWGWFSPEVEKAYVAGEVLRPEDWRSGDRLWLVDLIAPYRGLTSGIVRWVMTPGNFAEREFWYRRVRDGNRTRKILHIRVDRDVDKATVLGEADFR